MKNYNDIMSVLKACEANILQVAGYRNAVGDQECIIIFESDPVNLFTIMKDLRVYGTRNRLPMPLVLNREFVMSALDSYPLEFLNISSQYRNIMVKHDLLAELSYAKPDLRLQIERELKSKWLLTRMATLEKAYSAKGLSLLLRKSIHSIYPALKGFSFLAGRGVPSDRKEIISNASQITGLDLELISSLSESTQSNLEEVTRYLALLHQLDLALDQITL